MGCPALLRESSQSQGIEPRLSCLPHWQAGSLHHERHLGVPHFNLIISLKQHLHIQAHSETVRTCELGRERGTQGDKQGKAAGTFLLL